MNLLYVVRHSLTPGRYCVDGIDLNSGDLIAFIDGNTVLQGRIDHHVRGRGRVYFVITQDGRQLPLSGIFYARLVVDPIPPPEGHRKPVVRRLGHHRA